MRQIHSSLVLGCNYITGSPPPKKTKKTKNKAGNTPGWLFPQAGKKWSWFCIHFVFVFLWNDHGLKPLMLSAMISTPPPPPPAFTRNAETRWRLSNSNCGQRRGSLHQHVSCQCRRDNLTERSEIRQIFKSSSLLGPIHLSSIPPLPSNTHTL